MKRRSVSISVMFVMSFAIVMALPGAAQQTQKSAASNSKKGQSVAPSAPASDTQDSQPIVFPITGKGTTNFLPVFTGTSKIGNSLVSQTGNGITVSGTVGAVSFSGDGSALSNVPAIQLGGLPASAFAQQGASNNFTADQTITGNLNLTGYINNAFSSQGNLTDANGQEGANVIGGFEGNAAFGGNTIAPGVIGGTIGGGGGVYDPSLLPQPTVLSHAKLPAGIKETQIQTGTRQPVAGKRQGRSSLPPGLISGANSVQQSWGTVAGGLSNSANGEGATVVGGYFNSAPGEYAFVGGGAGNTASGAYDAVVVGGDANTASGGFAFVGGGVEDTASGYNSTVAGGDVNQAMGDNSTVAGGYFNTAQGWSSAVGGGSYNYAYGTTGTVPGGSNNTAFSDNTFAAGCQATANYVGSFVWGGDSTQGCVSVQDTGASQFVALAPGGFYLYTSVSGASGSGAILASGSGSWSSLSDRNAKANFLAIDPSLLLEKLAAMPVSTWNYKTQADSIRHLGPTAQDFHAAFGLGEDDKHISTVDAEGVALVGLQALYQTVKELREGLDKKDQQISELRARLASLEHLAAAQTK